MSDMSIMSEMAGQKPFFCWEKYLTYHSLCLYVEQVAQVIQVPLGKGKGWV